MERNTQNKVYINPNFKRAEIDTWPETIKTTHFNRYYLEEIPNKKKNINLLPSSNNRKIYVNPNFIAGNNLPHNNPHTTAAKTELIEGNQNTRSVLNKHPLHKSKYSLVCNIQQTCLKNVLDKEKKRVDMYHENNGQNVIEDKSKGPIYTQEIPLTRSRYCIVRKKRKLSVNLEKARSTLTSLDSNNSYSVPIVCANQLNFYGIKNNEMIKVSCKTPQKIKLTKYKTIPISYLKKSPAVDINKNRRIIPATTSFIKSNAKLSRNSSIINVNKNRFKFIKSSTPIKSNKSCIASTILTTSRVAQYENKNASIYHSKIKLLRTKFNINNTPCRLFKKYGKCLRQEKGNCKYLHDKKHVSLCRKFLKGICHDKDCPLSHELTSKKMPTCYFYLNGMCTKEHCPYLHVKLSDKTKMCHEFGKGYCESGDKCPFKHVTNQLKTRETSTNRSGIPAHNQIAKSKPIKLDHAIKIKNTEEVNKRDNNDCRYYQDLPDTEVSFESIKPKRCKLGELPSFIEL